AKNKRDAGGAAGGSSSSLNLGQPSPAPSFDGDRTKRVRVEDPEDTTSQKQPKIIDLEDPSNSLSSSLHKLTPGVPAGQFVLPPAFSHGQLFDGNTKMKISLADEAIL
ncbi:hypothetical protein A2U01_0067337, partial [Trifolium medium]|nr:hypothetical protein [Trifolium medium]